MLKRNLCVAVLCGIAGDEVIRSVCRAIGLPRRKIPQALQNKQEPEKLSAALKARDETLAAVSHDLRNLVNVISLASSNLAEKSSSSEKETRLIGIINRSTRQMDRMIQDLTDIVNVEAGQELPLERRPISPKDLLTEASDLSRPSVERKAIDLRWDYHNGNWMVDADRRRILQVFCNLIDNAVKFSSRESTITLDASRKDEEGLFSVSDNGPGIPPDEQDKIFQPFWRKEHSGTQGAGLGLAIARRIVDQHGGHIWIESRSGIGTTFRFTLPLSHAFAAADQ